MPRVCDSGPKPRQVGPVSTVRLGLWLIRWSPVCRAGAPHERGDAGGVGIVVAGDASLFGVFPFVYAAMKGSVSHLKLPGGPSSSKSLQSPPLGSWIASRNVQSANVAVAPYLRPSLPLPCLIGASTQGPRVGCSPLSPGRDWVWTVEVSWPGTVWSSSPQGPAPTTKPKGHPPSGF